MTTGKHQEAVKEWQFLTFMVTKDLKLTMAFMKLKQLELTQHMETQTKLVMHQVAGERKRSNTTRKEMNYLNQKVIKYNLTRMALRASMLTKTECWMGQLEYTI